MSASEPSAQSIADVKVAADHNKWTKYRETKLTALENDKKQGSSQTVDDAKAFAEELKSNAFATQEAKWEKVCQSQNRNPFRVARLTACAIPTEFKYKSDLLKALLDFAKTEPTQLDSTWNGIMKIFIEHVEKRTKGDEKWLVGAQAIMNGET